jgi:hypothetical protein
MYLTQACCFINAGKRCLICNVRCIYAALFIYLSDCTVGWINVGTWLELGHEYGGDLLEKVRTIACRKKVVFGKLIS